MSSPGKDRPHPYRIAWLRTKNVDLAHKDEKNVGRYVPLVIHELIGLLRDDLKVVDQFLNLRVGEPANELEIHVSGRNWK